MHARQLVCALSVSAVAALTSNPAAGQPEGRYSAGPHAFACTTCHVSSANVTPASQSYAFYDARTNPDFGGGRVAPGQEPGGSLTCLGCHDGSISASNRVMTGTGGIVASAPSLGVDLGNDHPVGFSYVTSLAAGKVLARTPPAELKLFGQDRRVECATCHDIHAIGRPHLLRMSTDNSALCLGCHI